MKYTALVVGSFLATALSSTVFAQEGPRLAFDIGGGFTQALGREGARVDDGWNVTGGVGVNFSQWAGLMVDASYNRFDINGATLNRIGFPGGDVNVFSATLNPVIHLTPRSFADVYLIGGGGYYRYNREFTEPGAAPFVGFDPFFGFYSGLVPTTQVVSSYTINKPGVDAGVGFAVGTKWHGKVFAEARWNRIFIGNGRFADYIPVSFGFRF